MDPRHLARGAVDAALATTILVLAVVQSIAPLRRPRGASGARQLLVLDTAYTLAKVRSLELEASIEARDLEGFFEHVWSVHPLVGGDPADAPLSHRLEQTQISARHTVIEAWFDTYSPFPLTAFARSQSRLLRYLRRVFADNSIAAIRAGDPYYLGLLGLFLAKTNGVPLVIRINGNYDAIYNAVGRCAYPRIFRRRSVEKRIDRFVLTRAALVIAANRDNLQFGIDNGAPTERTAIFPYGNLIHPVHFAEPATRESVAWQIAPPDTPLIVYVTRLEAVKHPEDLLEVAAALATQGRSGRVVFVGDGSLRQALESEVEARNLGDRVVFAGARPQRWIASLLAEAAVIAAPHNGRALVESALSGRPLVVYDLDWHREFVVDGHNGRLVPYRRPDLLAEAVLELLDDAKRADDLGRTARDEALSSMSPSLLAANERRAYAALLGAQ